VTFAGVRVIEHPRHEDRRGWFLRTFDATTLRSLGLESRVAQCSVSFNRHKGTVRGLHWQVEPCEETKLITCLRGGIFDVLVDMREGSATFGKTFSVELWEGDGKCLFVPRGVAHGFQTLTEDTLVSYTISVPQSEAHARRARWNDPAFGIEWPLPVSVMSELDRDAPLMGAGR